MGMRDSSWLRILIYSLTQIWAVDEATARVMQLSTGTDSVKSKLVDVLFATVTQKAQCIFNCACNNLMACTEADSVYLPSYTFNCPSYMKASCCLCKNAQSAGKSTFTHVL